MKKDDAVQGFRHIDSLRPNPNNPRGAVDAKAPDILELAASIKEQGILQPLLITPDGVIVAGHRRRTAAKIAGVVMVPVIERALSEQAQLLSMLVENMQRESLSMLQEAQAFAKLMESGNLGVMDLSRLLGLPPQTISERLPILKLPESVQALYAKNALSVAAAKQLLRFESVDRQIRVANQLACRSITLPQLKQMADVAQPPAPKTAGKPRKAAEAPSRPEPADEDPPRAAVVARLGRMKDAKVSFSTVLRIANATCCTCGMEQFPEVCKTCPLPQFLNRLASAEEAHGAQQTR